MKVKLSSIKNPEQDSEISALCQLAEKEVDGVMKLFLYGSQQVSKTEYCHIMISEVSGCLWNSDSWFRNRQLQADNTLLSYLNFEHKFCLSHIMKHLAKAVFNLHKAGYSHGDIKLQVSFSLYINGE